MLWWLNERDWFAVILRAVKVNIYPTKEQQQHLARAYGCVRWF